jgi:hypothetical protein
MAKLTEWLRIMLGEIARKQEESARAAAEAQQRQSQSQQQTDRPVRSAAR